MRTPSGPHQKFRQDGPSDVEFGSDGALYVSDWHNVIIRHMQHNIGIPP